MILVSNLGLAYCYDQRFGLILLAVLQYSSCVGSTMYMYIYPTIVVPLITDLGYVSYFSEGVWGLLPVRILHLQQ